MDEYVAKGKRGLAFLRVVRGERLLVKRRNPDSAVDTLANEARFTKLLNGVGVGPRFRSYKNGELVRAFVDGAELRHWLPDAPPLLALRVFRSVLRQCRAMDLAGVSKLEMTRPWKHVLVTRTGKAVLIDFERCREAAAPKNVTQFCQFLTSSRVAQELKKKKIKLNDSKIRDIAKKYKHNMRDNKRKKNNELYKSLVRLLTP